MNMNKKGFTLVEILIAASVGLIVMGAIYAAMNMGQRSSVAVERKIVAQQDARAALDIMATEIRMASYRKPYTPPVDWCDCSYISLPSQPTCTGCTSNQDYKGIREATANSITVEMDIDESSVIKDHADEIIRYEYLGDANNQRITRETNCGGGQAFLGDQVGNTSEVRVVNATAGAGGSAIPLFKYYYYDSGGVEQELVPGVDLPAKIPDIRRIEITLVVDTEAIDPNLGKRRRTFCSTSVIPRNHAINY